MDHDLRARTGARRARRALLAMPLTLALGGCATLLTFPHAMGGARLYLSVVGAVEEPANVGYGGLALGLLVIGFPPLLPVDVATSLAFDVALLPLTLPLELLRRRGRLEDEEPPAPARPTAPAAHHELVPPPAAGGSGPPRLRPEAGATGAGGPPRLQLEAGVADAPPSLEVERARREIAALEVSAVAADPAGLQAASAAPGAACVWTRAGHRVRPSSAREPRAVAVIGSALAVGDASGELAVWRDDAAEPARLRGGAAVTALALGQGGEAVVAGRATGEVTVWATAAGAPRTLPPRPGGGPIVGLAVLGPDLVVADAAGVAWLEGRLLERPPGPGDRAWTCGGSPLTAFAAAAPEGRRVLVVGHADGAIEALAPDAVALVPPGGAAVTALALAPGGEVLAWGTAAGEVGVLTVAARALPPGRRATLAAPVRALVLVDALGSESPVEGLAVLAHGEVVAFR